MSYPLAPLGALCTFVAGSTPPSADPSYWTDPNEGTPWVAIGDMSSVSLVSETVKGVTQRGLEVARLRPEGPGTVLFAMYASVGEVSVLGMDAVWNQALLGITSLDPRVLDQRYLYWALTTLKPDLPPLFRSNTQNNLNAEQVRQLRIPLPASNVQVRIADFLDRETSEMSEMTDELYQLIARLRERAVSVVRSAFPTNIANDPMDLSPGWRSVPLQAIFQREKTLGFVDEPMVSVFKSKGVVFKDDHENLNRTAEDRSIYQLVEPGWLVVNRMKAWQGSVGVSSIRGISSGHYICFRPLHAESHSYLNYLLRSPQYTDWYAAISRGVRPGQQEIDNQHLAQTPIFLPPLADQKRIVARLDRETAEIDSMIGDAQKLKSLIDERRSALIADVVTGRKEID